jgi:hypothetical protein
LLQESKRSEEDLAGRNDGNIKVIIPSLSVPVEKGSNQLESIRPGDYIAVKVRIIYFIQSRDSLVYIKI